MRARERNVPRTRSVGCSSRGAQNPHRPHTRDPGAPAALALLRRRSKRPKFGLLDRAFWMWLSQWWTRWSEVLHVVKPQTVIRWHRQSFRAFWTWKSRRGRVGRPRVGGELADLVRTMALANPLWGAPRIHGELLKLGFDVSQRTVARLMPRRPKPIADMEDVPPKPRRRPCLSRFLRRADCDIPNPLRVRGPAAPSPASRALQRHGLAHCRLDGAANCRSLSRRFGATLSPPRSRQHLRWRVSATGEGHVHRRGSLVTTLPLAEPLCRTSHRHPPP